MSKKFAKIKQFILTRKAEEIPAILAIIVGVVWYIIGLSIMLKAK